MSGYGLPKTLELILNNILQDSQLASYKIAGNGPRTTIVLRFDACMEDASVSPLHQSTPESYRRKSSSQSNKELERHVKLQREEMDYQNNSSSKRNVTAAMNLKSKDDSAFHSLSLLDRSTSSLTNREIAHNERKQAKSPNKKVLLKTAVKKDQQGGGEQQIFATTLGEEAKEKDETSLKVKNQCTDLSNSQGNQDTDILDQHTEDSSNTADTREQKTPESSLRTRSSATEILNTEYSEREHKVKANESKNLKTDEAAQAKGHHIHDEESKMKDNKLKNKISCDKVQARNINTERDNKKLVNRPRRKNTLKKIILDTSWGVMVAETEDFIFEYSMTREMITNHYVKEEEQESPYCKMRKQHLRDWPDDTLRIEEEGHTEALSKFQKQLQHFIASH